MNTNTGITSKYTSINSTKLPAVYNKINWDALMSQWCKEHDGENPIGIVLDYGCGRYTDHIQDFVNQQGFYYIGFDPYWNDIDFTTEINQISKINGGGVVAIICSNVLNVIPSWMGVKRVDALLKSLAFSLAKNAFSLLFTRVINLIWVEKPRKIAGSGIALPKVICSLSIR